MGNQPTRSPESQLVKSTLDSVRSASTPATLLSSLQSLEDVARQAKNRAELFKQGAAPLCVTVFTKTQDDQVKQLAMNIVFNLSNILGAESSLVRVPGLVNGLLAGSQSPFEPLMYASVSTLSNLSNQPSVRAFLFEFPQLVDFAIQAIAHKRCEENWLDILQNFLTGDGNRELDLISRPAMHSALIQNKSAKIAELIFRLSLSADARVSLHAKPDVVSHLEDMTKDMRDERTRVFATLALAIVAGADEALSKLLRSSPACLDSILQVLEGAIERKYAFGTNDWKLATPLLCIRFLSTVDSNRTAFLNAKSGRLVLILLLEALELAASDRDAPAADLAITCLLNFAFDEAPLAELRGNGELQLSLTKYVKTWPQVRKPAQGLLFKLGGKADQVLPILPTAPSQTPRLMISYAWGPAPHKNRDVARQVAKFFKNRGCEVWRDEERMDGDVFDAMANAVRGADAIVVLVNRDYLESANCKLELSFATNNGKKIIPLLVQSDFTGFRSEGWLGFMIGSILYYSAFDSGTMASTLQVVWDKEVARRTAPTARRLSTGLVTRADFDALRLQFKQQQQEMQTEIAKLRVEVDALKKA
jgi:hypothetical protein